jgi:putative ABC transport system permease protein
LVAATLYGLVMMRRKDFGRRRALGATRTYIVSLLVTQTAILAIAGIILGLAGAITAAAALGDPLPSSASSPHSPSWRYPPPWPQRSSPR